MKTIKKATLAVILTIVVSMISQQMFATTVPKVQVQSEQNYLGKLLDAQVSQNDSNENLRPDDKIGGSTNNGGSNSRDKKDPPVLTNITIARTSATTSTFTFTSNKAGTLYYIVDNDGNFTDTDYDTIDKINAETSAYMAIMSGTNTVAISGLASKAAARIYFFTKDQKDKTSSTIGIQDIPTGDFESPALTDITTARTSATTGTITFTSNEAGTLYYIVDNDGSFTDTDYDTIDKINAATPAYMAIVSGTNITAISKLVSKTAARIYFFTKDQNGNISATIEIQDIPYGDFEAPAIIDVKAARTSFTTGTFTFTSNEAGTLYYVIDNDGNFTDTDYDTIDKINGATPTAVDIVSGTNTTSCGDLTISTAARIYYYAKDDKGNTSDMVGIQDVLSAVPTMTSTVSRDNNNVVTLTWYAVPGAVGYNIYDATFNSKQTSAPYKNTYNTPVKLTESPVTSCTYANGNLSAGISGNGLVHRLTIKAVAGDGTEFTTSTNQIGILEYINTPFGTRLNSLKGKTLKMPVSDFTNNLEFIGPVIKDPKWQYWCFSALDDPNNPGKIHLFLTRIPATGDFGNTWRTQSEIVHMVGDSYEGPFTEVGIVRTNGKMADPNFKSAHNSRIKYIDGKYVLLYIEIRNPIYPETAPPQLICMETVDPASLPGGCLPTTPNDESYWTPVTGVNNKADGVILKSDLQAKKVNNPDILKTPSGTYNLIYKSDTPTSGGDYIYKATSKNLTGPYTPMPDSLKIDSVARENQAFLNPQKNIEDHQLFQWKNKYFMLNYDLYSQYTSNEANTYPGILWVSRDGEKFDASNAYIAEGQLSDYVKKPDGALCGYGGDSGGTTRMERPYLIFDRNGEPTYFIGTNAWNLDGDENGGTTNVPGLASVNIFRVKPLPMHNINVSTSANTNGNITVTKVEGNDVRASQDKAEQYDDVYFTVTPDQDFTMKNGTLVATATDSIGTPINVTIESLGNNQYRFIMPPGNVTITAQYRSTLPANITGVNVTQSGTNAILQGGTAQFAAEVVGTGGFDGLVTWAVSGNDSTLTTINSTSGLLTISPYETASQLVVTATSVDDPTKSGSLIFSYVNNIAVMRGTANNAVVTASSFFFNGAYTNCLYPRNLNDGVTKLVTPVNTGAPTGSGYANAKPTEAPAGAPNTYYASTGSANVHWQPASSPRDTNPWLQFNFSSPQTFNTIISFESGPHNTDGYLKSYDLQTSTDGTTWTTVQTIVYPTAATLKKVVTLNASVTSQYVRLANMKSSSATTSFWNLLEIQIYNMPVSKISGVSVSPTAPTIVKDTTQQFSETVNSTGEYYSSGVSWNVTDGSGNAPESGTTTLVQPVCLLWQQLKLQIR